MDGKPDEVPDAAWIKYQMDLSESTIPLNSRQLPFPILYDGLFSYGASHAIENLPHCHLQLYEIGNTRLAIVTQVITNKGGSITNYIEDIATLIANGYKIPPDRLLLLEHYPAHAHRIDYHSSGRKREGRYRNHTTYDIVRFNWIINDYGIQRATTPQWIRLSALQVHGLIHTLDTGTFTTLDDLLGQTS